MKWIVDVIAVILTLIGIVWTLQGANIVSVGAMAGRNRWTVIGLVMGVVGIGVLIIVNL